MQRPCYSTREAEWDAKDDPCILLRKTRSDLPLVRFYHILKSDNGRCEPAARPIFFVADSCAFQEMKERYCQYISFNKQQFKARTDNLADICIYKYLKSYC